MLYNKVLQVINAFLTIILAVAMVLYLNVPLALIVVACVPLTYFSAQFILKKSQPYFKAQADTLGEMNGFVQEKLTGFTVLKLYGREKVLLKNFVKLQKNCAKSV